MNATNMMTNEMKYEERVLNEMRNHVTNNTKQNTTRQAVRACPEPHRRLASRQTCLLGVGEANPEGSHVARPSPDEGRVGRLPRRELASRPVAKQPLEGACRLTKWGGPRRWNMKEACPPECDTE